MECPPGHEDEGESGLEEVDALRDGHMGETFASVGVPPGTVLEEVGT